MLSTHRSILKLLKGRGELTQVIDNILKIAFARGGAHLPIAHALRLLSTKELRFGLTKFNLRKNNFLN